MGKQFVVFGGALTGTEVGGELPTVLRLTHTQVAHGTQSKTEGFEFFRLSRIVIVRANVLERGHLHRFSSRTRTELTP